MGTIEIKARRVRERLLVEARDFFFQAMAQGWAAGKAAIKSPDRLGHYYLIFEQGEFVLIDEWAINELSKKSAGTTTVWYGGQPVWFMSYSGFYPESSIKIVKQALLAEYCAKRFTGGRGPSIYRMGDLEYYNEPNTGSSFERFSGREFVIDRNSVSELGGGSHTYMGQALI